MSDQAEHDAALPLVFPLGQFLGAREDGTTFEVRVAADVHALDGARFSVWALAHGLPGHTGPWTDEDVVDAAARAGAADPAADLDALTADGLLLHVGPGGARSFAEGVRLLPAVPGLGNTAEQPGTWSLGLLGQPLVGLDAALYDLVVWAHCDPSLWEACRGASATSRRARVPGAEDADALLARLVDALHTLLAVGAVRLDTWPVTA